MSDLPEPQNIRERWNIERDGDGLRVCFNEHERSASCRYERFVPESVAREAMDRGRRAGLEEAARIAQAQAETLAEELYGHPREKAVEWDKEDKFDSHKDNAERLLSIVVGAIRSAGEK